MFNKLKIDALTTRPSQLHISRISYIQSALDREKGARTKAEIELT